MSFWLKVNNFGNIVYTSAFLFIIIIINININGL